MVKQRGLRLVRIILLTLAALLLAAGLAGVFSGWKIAFLGVLCAAAWIDWAQAPKGRQTEVGRMGFVHSTPNLLMAVLLTLAFLVVLCGGLPAEQ